MGVKRLYLNENVFDAALERVRWVFREFQTVYVSFSGGKDSTVVLNLALQVAEEMGRLPVPVMFIDQEAEWQSVIDYIRTVMHDPRVSPRWLQVPIKLFNATSTSDPWLYCWDPLKQSEWIRPKEEKSLKRNIYGTDRFKELFDQYHLYHHRTKPIASLTGMRCEESPGRTLGLTASECYQGVTWGGCRDFIGARRKHFRFSPIYDWSYTDVWKAIHDHAWPYCTLYNSMHQYGVPILKMRVSNVHHETATSALWYLQEIEPMTWERVTQRLHGINSAGQLRGSFFQPKVLPPMFSDWVTYRDYLLANLIEPLTQVLFAKQFAQFDLQYRGNEKAFAGLVQAEIRAVLLNDYHGTVIGNFTSAHVPPGRKVRRAAAAAEAVSASEGTEGPCQDFWPAFGSGCGSYHRCEFRVGHRGRHRCRCGVCLVGRAAAALEATT